MSNGPLPGYAGFEDAILFHIAWFLDPIDVVAPVSKDANQKFPKTLPPLH
jgi:hypothetical protein